MSTRAELESAILTQPYNAAREAAYLDWLQEFEPHALELARFGLEAYWVGLISHVRNHYHDITLAETATVERLVYRVDVEMRFGIDGLARIEACWDPMQNGPVIIRVGPKEVVLASLRESEYSPQDERPYRLLFTTS